MRATSSSRHTHSHSFCKGEKELQERTNISLFYHGKITTSHLLNLFLLINAQELALKYMRSMPYYFPHSFIWRQIKFSQFLHGKHFSPRLRHDVSLQGSGKHDPGKAIPHTTEISKNIISVDILLRQDFFCYVRQFAKWHKD